MRNWWSPHCGLMPASAFGNMNIAQRFRDAHQARALVDAAEANGSAFLLAGNGHVRTDRAVPWYVRRMAPGRKVVSVMLLEVTAGPDRCGELPAARSRRQGCDRLRAVHAAHGASRSLPEDARTVLQEEVVTAGMRSWIEFWDSEHAIYVNDRHKQLHAQAVGAGSDPAYSRRAMRSCSITAAARPTTRPRSRSTAAGSICARRREGVRAGGGVSRHGASPTSRCSIRRGWRPCPIARSTWWWPTRSSST